MIISNLTHLYAIEIVQKLTPIILPSDASESQSRYLQYFHHFDNKSNLIWWHDVWPLTTICNLILTNMMPVYRCHWSDLDVDPACNGSEVAAPACSHTKCLCWVGGWVVGGEMSLLWMSPARWAQLYWPLPLLCCPPAACCSRGERQATPGSTTCVLLLWPILTCCYIAFTTLNHVAQSAHCCWYQHHSK